MQNSSVPHLTEEWGDMGRSLGESLGPGYQAERSKIVGLCKIIGEVSLHIEISYEESVLSFSKFSSFAFIYHVSLPWSILSVLIAPLC